MCRTRACRRRLRRENVVNDWMSGRKKSKVVLFGVVTDEMPSEVKVNKRLSTVDYNDMITYRHSKRRCFEPVMSEG